jgi:hypothetical protein
MPRRYNRFIDLFGALLWGSTLAELLLLKPHGAPS